MKQTKNKDEEENLKKKEKSTIKVLLLL